MNHPGKDEVRCPVFGDARIWLPLTFLLGILVWRAGPVGLCFYLAAVCLLFPPVPGFFSPGDPFGGGLYRRLPQGALWRTFLFALFWPLLKFATDLAPLAGLFFSGGLCSGPPDLSGAAGLEFRRAVLFSASESGLLFLRLLVLLGSGLALGLAVPPRALALAFCWYPGLVGGRAAVRILWKPALALAVMIQYLPRIHRLSRQLRLAAKARRLPDSGFAYWRMAFPQMFRLLSENAWNAALGIAARRLDSPEAWSLRAPLAFAELAPALLLAAVLAALSAI